MLLITGGAGFIGSHLCDRLLARGYEVLCLDNFNDFYDPALKEENVRAFLGHPRFTLVRGDILDRSLLEDLFSQYPIRKLVHLAAIAGVRPSLVDPARYVRVDVEGTVNLLEMAKKHRVEQFIFGSSSSVYGRRAEGPFSEDDPTDCQISPYATAKKAGELFCATYHQLYGIPITILRFFTVYGPRQRPDMAIRKFAELMLQGKPIPLYGEGSSLRDYTYVDDCVDGIVAAIEKVFSFEIFNLGSGRAVPLKKVVELLSRHFGVEPQVDLLPEQPGDVPVTCADISKAKKLLHYEPKVSLEEGVRRFVEWLKARYSEPKIL
jgi:UDP-glucuronate 4-epimerase